MSAPSVSGLCAETTSIVVAEYRSYTSQSILRPITYSYPPIAIFKRIQTVEGSEGAEQIKVRFDFNDGSPCIDPTGWSFSESKMPAKGHHLILFLTSRDDHGVYRTYRGNFGRLEPGAKSDALIRSVKECLPPP